jgi:hypothetical protein
MQNIRMETKTNTFENFPEWLLEKWQGIADVLAETIGVTAALITMPTKPTQRNPV